MNASYLEHHGILGQKWGVRRFQNPDGSLTPAGVKRYLTGDITKEVSTHKNRQLTPKDKKFFYNKRNKMLNEQGIAYNENQFRKYDKRRKEADKLLKENSEYRLLARKVDRLQKRIDKHEQQILNKGITDDDELMRELNNTDLYAKHYKARNDLADFALTTLSGKDWFDDTITQLGTYNDMDARIIPMGETVTTSILQDYL